MRWITAVLAALFLTGQSRGYVEAPYSLGRVLNESTHVVLVEVSRVDKTKGLVVYKKVQDIKGKHPKDEIKHNIGKRGFHPREPQNILDWAEPGKRAMVFHNGSASETCIGGYWYQCYPEGPEWWGMTHAEPFMLRTFCGDVDKLAAAVTQMQAGKEVQVSCFADLNREQLHLKKGKMQTVWASLKRIEWNPKRDFVGWGGDGVEVQEFKTVNLLPEGAEWRFLPEKNVNEKGFGWTKPDFDDRSWKSGKAPIGYGEDEIGKRKGTTIAEKGCNFVFRRTFTVPSELLSEKAAVFRLNVASDDSAIVFINGQVADRDPEEDHEFAYWNREVDLNRALLRPGVNSVAVLVKNHLGSSDLYLDMEISVMIPLPKKAAVKK